MIFKKYVYLNFHYSRCVLSLLTSLFLYDCIFLHMYISKYPCIDNIIDKLKYICFIDSLLILPPKIDGGILMVSPSNNTQGK